MEHLKFLTADGRGPYSRYRWPIGEWVRVDGPLVLCRNGIHVCTLAQSVEWLDARCHPVEIDGEQIGDASKLCVRAARLGPALVTWNEQTQRLFAADCAERVLPLYEREATGDTRPREAVEMARRFARREATSEQLAAAGDAARAAAWAAAMAAAMAAAGDAARAAAWAAAMAAAGDAAGAAAGDAELAWQSDHLGKILRGELYAEFTGEAKS